MVPCLRVRFVRGVRATSLLSGTRFDQATLSSLFIRFHVLFYFGRNSDGIRSLVTKFRNLIWRRNVLECWTKFCPERTPSLSRTLSAIHASFLLETFLWQSVGWLNVSRYDVSTFFSNSQLFLSFSFFLFFFFFLEHDPWNGPSTICRYTRCENILLEDGGMKVRDDSSIRSMRCNRKSSLRIKFRISECTWCTCNHTNVKESCLFDSIWLLDAKSGFSLSFKVYQAESYISLWLSETQLRNLLKNGTYKSIQ